MKRQQINVYARFITDEVPAPDPARAIDARARRSGRRAGGESVRSPKQGLKKRGNLPK